MPRVSGGYPAQVQDIIQCFPVILSFYDEATSADILQVMHLVRKEISHHSDAAISASRHNHSAALPWKSTKSPLFRPDGEPEFRIVIKTLVPLVRATARPRLRQAAKRREEDPTCSNEMKELVGGKRVLIYICCSHIQQTDKRSSMERQFQSILGTVPPHRRRHARSCWNFASSSQQRIQDRHVIMQQFDARDAMC
jgi:hypothetical protein